MRKIRVLIIDDSALVRQIVQASLSADPGIEVVGVAQDPFMARDKIISLLPDVLTLDVEMPRMDGVEFLRRLMPQYPLPVVMLSSLTQRGKQITLDALEAGAVDFVSKPAGDQGRKLPEVMQELRTKIKIAASANVSHWKEKRDIPTNKNRSRDLKESTDKVIALGASTGGTEAIRRILPQFPVDSPGMVIVQHMPPGFTKMFADRLNTQCPMEVREAQSGDRIIPGRVLVAPGGMQMRVHRSGGIYEVICHGDEKVSGHCPSVDVLMHSVATDVGANSIGIMLTGMGGDGAQGMLAMRKKGARTVAQDERSCVVFGMPKVALEKGGAECAKSLDEIPNTVLDYLRAGSKA
jgi:two-component system, chemotaxis family, protein-glutamate methylesterase/glutaminase